MKNENKLLKNNVSYKVISKNQKLENDKERIISRFNFNISRTSTNSSALKQSSLLTQQNSCLFSDKIEKIKKKINYQNTKILNKNRAYTTQKTKKTITKIYINNLSKGKENNKESNIINYEKNNCPNLKDTNLLSENIISNITYNNYDKYYIDNSSLDSEIQRNALLDSILKTQTIEEGLNRSDSKYDNNGGNKNINENDANINIKNENEEGTRTLKENEFLKSFNNTSFSGSSKTSEINRDNLYIRSGDINSNADNIGINNNNNYIIRNYNLNNSINPSINYYKNKKISTGETFLQEIFIPFKSCNYQRKRTEVDANNLLDDDEYNQDNRQKMVKNVSKYYFIDDIILKNNNYISLSLEKFVKLNKNLQYTIFSFVFDNYKNFLNSSKTIRNIIINMLDEKFGKCIKDFKSKYQNILILEKYNYNIENLYKSKLMNKKFIKFNLYLKTKVLPNNKYLNKYGDIGFEISYKYKIKNLKDNYNSKSNRTYISNQSYISKDHIQEEFTQIYKFDLRKNENYSMWLCSERDEFFNYSSKVCGVNNLITKIKKKDELYQNHLIYSSPIISVNENDYIIFRIGLIEDNNIIEDIQFNNIIIESIYDNYFHKNSYKIEQKFDKMRDCENEIVINIWHDECAIKEYCNKIAAIKYETFIFKVKQYFQDYFEIIETKFDMSKYIFIRLTMKAKKIGILKNSIFSNKDIKIVDKNTCLTKECIPINFVNAFSMNKYLYIKQDTIVYFYLME